MAEDSNVQRLEGAKLIISSATIFALEKEIELINHIWNGRIGIDNRENHTLELTAKDGKVVKGQFSREELEDYPGRIGTEKTDAKLRRMIDVLNGN